MTDPIRACEDTRRAAQATLTDALLAVVELRKQFLAFHRASNEERERHPLCCEFIGRPEDTFDSFVRDYSAAISALSGVRDRR